MICLWFWLEGFLCFIFKFIVVTRIGRFILCGATSSGSSRIVFICFILKLIVVILIS